MLARSIRLACGGFARLRIVNTSEPDVVLRSAIRKDGPTLELGSVIRTKGSPAHLDLSLATLDQFTYVSHQIEDAIDGNSVRTRATQFGPHRAFRTRTVNEPISSPTTD
jgi:hypothetical protein